MVLAKFTDSDTAGTAADWTNASTTINFGDGSDSVQGTIVKNSDGTF